MYNNNDSAKNTSSLPPSAANGRVFQGAALNSILRGEAALDILNPGNRQQTKLIPHFRATLERTLGQPHITTYNNNKANNTHTKDNNTTQHK